MPTFFRSSGLTCADGWLVSRINADGGCATAATLASIVTPNNAFLTKPTAITTVTPSASSALIIIVIPTEAVASTAERRDLHFSPYCAPGAADAFAGATFCVTVVAVAGFTGKPRCSIILIASSIGRCTVPLLSTNG